MLDEFIAGLASGETNLFTGPLNYQDGSEYLADGEEATDLQIWYTTQLLEGIEGASAPSDSTFDWRLTVDFGHGRPIDG